MFAGESMFYRLSNASKVAFAALVAQLRRMQVTLFDAQVLTPVTEQLGAEQVSRRVFLDQLRTAVAPGSPWDGRTWSQETVAICG